MLQRHRPIRGCRLDVLDREVPQPADSDDTRKLIFAFNAFRVNSSGVDTLLVLLRQLLRFGLVPKENHQTDAQDTIIAAAWACLSFDVSFDHEVKYQLFKQLIGTEKSVSEAEETLGAISISSWNSPHITIENLLDRLDFPMFKHMAPVADKAIHKNPHGVITIVPLTEEEKFNRFVAPLYQWDGQDDLAAFVNGLYTPRSDETGTLIPVMIEPRIIQIRLVVPEKGQGPSFANLHLLRIRQEVHDIPSAEALDLSAQYALCAVVRCRENEPSLGHTFDDIRLYCTDGREIVPSRTSTINDEDREYAGEAIARRSPTRKQWSVMEPAKYALFYIHGSLYPPGFEAESDPQEYADRDWKELKPVPAASHSTAAPSIPTGPKAEQGKGSKQKIISKTRPDRRL